MKINIRIGKLVLHGFNYHDHKRVGTALEQELARLIKENGLPEGSTKEIEIPKIGAPSFSAPADMNPTTIGTEVARSIYRSKELVARARLVKLSSPNLTLNRLPK